MSWLSARGAGADRGLRGVLADVLAVALAGVQVGED